MKARRVRKPAVQSALGKLPEQGFRLAVFEVRDKVDLEDLGESLRESRSHKVFPVQRESQIRVVSTRAITSKNSKPTVSDFQFNRVTKINEKFLKMY